MARRSCKQGNTTFQFGQQRSFEQRYNTNNLFDPYAPRRALTLTAFRQEGRERLLRFGRGEPRLEGFDLLVDARDNLSTEPRINRRASTTLSVGKAAISFAVASARASQFGGRHHGVDDACIALPVRPTKACP